MKIVGVSTFVVLVIAIITFGFLYTLIHGVLVAFPTGPNTQTMQFLDFVLTYFMIPLFLFTILWYLGQNQRRGSR